MWNCPQQAFLIEWRFRPVSSRSHSNCYTTLPQLRHSEEDNYKLKMQGELKVHLFLGNEQKCTQLESCNTLRLTESVLYSGIF